MVATATPTSIAKITITGTTGGYGEITLVEDAARNSGYEDGYDEENYPYWVRNDGCKMLGPYIMCAADQSIRPLGTIIDTSLGKAIVCDTGEFIYANPYQLDIAVTW